jgi:hypothetical protein
MANKSQVSLMMKFILVGRLRLKDSLTLLGNADQAHWNFIQQEPASFKVNYLGSK